MLSRLRHWSQHLQLDAALPPSCCALCGCAAASALCQFCRQRVCGQVQARCVQCALPLAHPAEGAGAAGARCAQCIRQAPAFDATIAAVDYAPPVDQLVLALKFGKQLALATLFAQMLRDALLQAPPIALPTLLCATPLGRRRLVERGFNQALEIAKPLSRTLGITLNLTLAARVRETAPQALLHPDQRRQNIRHGFVISAGAQHKVRGCHIGVVDDVLTTGETLNELAATLKHFGAARVTNFVFARTPVH